MTAQEIKLALLEGQNFSNERADWYSYCKPSEKLFWIEIRERNFFYKNIDSVSKKISQLIKRGY